jgi:CheY-like chemotaxis protein/HPt (histidine-containing phosphotransfer) domain-containing protein
MTSGSMDGKSVIDSLRGEFLSDCLDHLERANEAVEGMAAKADDGEKLLKLIQHNVHTIKGTGGSFGFPSISRIAHALEDFMEAHPDILTDWLGIESYLDEIRRIADSGVDVAKEDLARIMDALPKAYRREAAVPAVPPGRRRVAAVRPVREVNVLLVMPKGVQRKIIGQELTSCGFGISFVDSGVAAIGVALARKPDMIASNMVLDDMTGADLARAVAGIEEIKDTRFVLITSSRASDLKAAGLPDGAAVVAKDCSYAEALTELLMEWGFFGEAGKKIAARKVS